MVKKEVILQVGPVYTEQISGLAISIPNTVRAIHDLGVTIALVTTAKKGTYDLNQPYPVFYFKNRNKKIKIIDLPKPYNEPTLIIFNSTYIPAHFALAQEAIKRGIPYIITPRGGMNIEAQKKKKVKKFLGNKLFFEKMVRSSSAIHCLTTAEEKELKGWQYQKSFVVGNGINIPKRIPKSKNKKNINFVYLSRKDVYTKGLDLLLEAIVKTQALLRKENIKIKLYGPGKPSECEYIDTFIKRHGIKDVVESHPAVKGEEKKNVLKDTDVFILTSRHEGHSMAILEALSYGIPCLLSTGTNSSKEVTNSMAGWEVKLNSQNISEGLTKVIKDKHKWVKMGENAKNHALANYEWSAIANKLIREYTEVSNS